jgi:predicted nuclease of predicted toxin-antitoxin system
MSSIVADEGIDAAIVERLRAAGIQVWYVAEMAPSLPDEQVFALANERDALLLTADKDFGTIVFQQRLVTSGVILVRLHGVEAKRKAELVTALVQERAEELHQAFTVLTLEKVRIRPQHRER